MTTKMRNLRTKHFWNKLWIRYTNLKPFLRKHSNFFFFRQAEQWDEVSCEIFDFEDIPLNKPTLEDEYLLRQYPVPHPKSFKASAVFQPQLTVQNYKQRMHDLLAIEEMAQFAQITRVWALFQCTTTVRLYPPLLSVQCGDKASVGQNLFVNTYIYQHIHCKVCQAWRVVRKDVSCW